MRYSILPYLDDSFIPYAGLSIQVFLNLKVLRSEIDNLKKSAVDTITQCSKTALDILSLMNQDIDPEKIQKFKSELIL